jgi:hypothetical protein
MGRIASLASLHFGDIAWHRARRLGFEHGLDSDSVGSVGATERKGYLRTCCLGSNRL